MSTNIPARFVGKNYKGRACAKVTSDNLEPGMIVLLADPRNRYEPNRDPGSMYNQRVTSRWCRVTEIEQRGDTISFIPVYSDGALRRRYYNKRIEWFVRPRP